MSGPSWVTNEACWPWPATSTKASVPIRPAMTQVKVETFLGLIPDSAARSGIIRRGLDCLADGRSVQEPGQSERHDRDRHDDGELARR